MSCSNTVYKQEANNYYYEKINLDILEVPDGLPEMEVNKRLIKKIFRNEKSDLVIVAFERHDKGLSPYSFVQAYNLKKDTSKLFLIDNEGNRLWKPRYVKLGANEIKIKFKSCTECDAENSYSLKFTYDDIKGRWFTSGERQLEKD